MTWHMQHDHRKSHILDRQSLLRMGMLHEQKMQHDKEGALGLEADQAGSPPSVSQAKACLISSSSHLKSMLFQVTRLEMPT